MIVWEGPSAHDGSPIVAIITGLERPSVNRKTGAMAQLWIMPQGMAPMDAVRTGVDAAVCGTCPLRGDGTGKGRACYVNLRRAPSTIWRKYADGGYQRVSLDQAADALAGHKIRLGAWGDPAMLPWHVAQRLALASIGWTGYTHQWRTLPVQWASILMASADTVADRRDARAAGWRSFHVVPVNAAVADVPHAVECAATRPTNQLQCADCLMCSGTRGRDAVGVDIVINAHGVGAKYVEA